MKYTILTPSLNQGDYIERNILSVINQFHTNFDIEHIVIDGGSNDSTLSILRKYTHLRWLSEKDKGQADALNKGLLLSRGDYIGWINSDDYYLENCLDIVHKEIVKNNYPNWLVGNLITEYFSDGTKIFVESPEISYEKLLKNPDIVKQPSTFFKKSFLEELNGWNERFYMVMDYDLWVRASKVSAPIKVNSVLAVFFIHEKQKTNPHNILRQIREIAYIMIRENTGKGTIFRLYRKKLISYIKKKIRRIVLPKK